MIPDSPRTSNFNSAFKYINKKMGFCGKYKGCYRETVVNCKGVAECEYKAEIKIRNVNCSQKTAYLISVKDSEGERESLAYAEDLDKPVLRSVVSDENGISSTYFEGKYLIHQISMCKNTSKGKEWVVKYYKTKAC